jgi:hypothetical protein
MLGEESKHDILYYAILSNLLLLPPSRSKYVLQLPVLEHVCPYLMRDKVSHPYKETLGL